MAREYEDIVKDLFAGVGSAINKLAKVRKAQYEMNLWLQYDVPLTEISSKVKRYFSERFLKGARCDQASFRTLEEGFKKLDCAVGRNFKKPIGCYARCLSLVNELNEALARDGLRTVEPEKFIDWLTFDCEAVVDHEGKPLLDKPYRSPVVIFHDDENRRLFWNELQKVMREHRRMSMQGVLRIMNTKQKESVLLKKEENRGEP
ncbi:hypothetical protein IKT18_02685 [Candidatus Saccharibacteria bacterium]|nr:hypothetical protein [Candidatus Saccharibacteria bacterium]